jgi:hypothetical protein
LVESSTDDSAELKKIMRKKRGKKRGKERRA